MRSVAILVLIFTFFSPLWGYGDEEENYCNDSASWADWESKAIKVPADLEFQTLHALRRGLCAKVWEGTISLDNASKIFESMRTTLIEKRREEQMRRSPSSDL
ncbi:MAG: Uncharacterized protein G01um101470_314 [Parcubacteria group bacterium Gr01-1014_70]|nr:MAG: Uncharacterized protein G01um101470_314 [Parcubacteria group bacterium Gr01-1014_70]